MDGAEGAVAVLHRVDDNPDRHQVLDLVELLALHDHLLVDGEVVLRAAGDVGPDAQHGQAVRDRFEHFAEVEVALGRPAGHHLLDLGVPLGIQHRERQVLELPLHVLDAEPVGQGGVDVERLLGDAALLALGEGGDRAHVVEPVGQLDQQDADVLGHGHQHLAQGGGLLGLLGVELEAIEFGDAVDDGGDVGPEVLGDVGQGDVGVLHRVVEEGGGDRHVVEPEAGQDAGHRQRVADVGVAGAAHLVLVGLLGEVEGPLDPARLPLGVALQEGRQHRGDLRRRVVAPPGHDRPAALHPQVDAPVDGAQATRLTRNGAATGCRARAVAGGRSGSRARHESVGAARGQGRW